MSHGRKDKPNRAVNTGTSISGAGWGSQAFLHGERFHSAPPSLSTPGKYFKKKSKESLDKGSNKNSSTQENMTSPRWERRPLEGPVALNPDEYLTSNIQDSLG